MIGIALLSAVLAVVSALIVDSGDVILAACAGGAAAAAAGTAFLVFLCAPRRSLGRRFARVAHRQAVAIRRRPDTVVHRISSHR